MEREFFTDDLGKKWKVLGQSRSINPPHELSFFLVRTDAQGTVKHQILTEEVILKIEADRKKPTE